LDLNRNEHKVVGCKARTRANCVDSVRVSLVTVFYDESDNLMNEVNGAFDVFEDGDARVRERAGRGGDRHVQGEVKWKSKLTAHSRNAADHVGAINGAAVPRACCNHVKKLAR
jgi:hypothetical protein